MTTTTVLAGPTSTVPATTTVPPTTTTIEPGPADTGDVVGFPTAVLTIGDEEVLVAMADDRDRRRQGLRGVEDLGDLTGMLFLWGRDVRSSFTMADTLIDLDIAFIDADGVVVDTVEMFVCTPTSCPTYGTFERYRYALETPLGSLDLERGDVVGLP